MLSRRHLLKLGLLSAPAILRFGRLRSPGGLLDGHDQDQQSSPRLTPFLDELPVPHTLPQLTKVPRFADITEYALQYVGDPKVSTTKFYEISTEERLVQFHQQLPPTSVWGYVDKNRAPSQDPPRLLAFRMPSDTGPGGDFVPVGQGPFAGFMVRHFNNLPTERRAFGFPFLSPHVHGGHQPAPADGFPADITNRFGDFPARVVIQPGQFFDYMLPLRDVGTFDNVPTQDERPAFLWFHDHTLDFTGANVYRGLANVMPVFDDIDTGNEHDGPPALGLPGGVFDIPLVVQDKIFDSSGALIFNADQGGFLGDTFVVNGVVQPFLNVQRRKYRFRFLNGSNARIYQIFLTNDLGQTFPMTQIATEGGLLAAPIRDLQSFTMSMAERFEMIVDFGHPIFDNQSVIYVENRMAQTDGRKPDGVVNEGPKILKFILTGSPPSGESDPGPVPDKLRPFCEVTPADMANAVHRSFRFDRSHGVFTINGEPVDLERPVAISKKNTPEIWHIENSSGGWWHPIHIHSELQRVLKRNGKLPPLGERDGNARKDTVLLRGGEDADVFLRFRDFTGPFVFHCHNIEHEDMSMMARFNVID